MSKQARTAIRKLKDGEGNYLLNKDAKKKDYSSLKYWKSHIFRRDYLIQQEGQYKGAPLRTTAGGRWLNGYSDHLPVVMYLVKEKK